MGVAIGGADYGDPAGYGDSAGYSDSLRKGRDLTHWAPMVRLAADRTGAIVSSPLWADWPGRIPPGPLGTSAEPFAGFVEPERKPVRRGPSASHVLHVPMSVRGDAAALALALRVAVDASVMREIDYLETWVTRSGDGGSVLRVFCGSVDVDGRRCARLYRHDPGENHDPDWQAMTPPGAA